MDFAQLDSKDIFHHSQTGYSPSGFLTPSSSAYEGRRDSIASCQSTSSYAKSFSSSFYSPQMPPTPSSQRDSLADDFTFVHYHSSFEGASPNSSVDASFGECQPEASLPIKPRPRSIEDHSTFGHEPGLAYVQPPEPYSPMRSIRTQQNDILPAASDFVSVLHSLVGSQPGQSPIQAPIEEVSMLNSWGTSSSYMTYPEQDLPYASYDTHPPSFSSSMQWEWGGLPSEPILPCMEAPSATIIPSDSIIEVEEGSYIPIQPDAFENGPSSYDGCSSPIPSPRCEVYVDTKTEPFHQMKEEPEEDAYEEKFSRSIDVSPTGGKGVKKERRGSRVPKKKSKTDKHKVGYLRLKEGPLRVKIDSNFEMDINGNYYPTNRLGSKKLVCNVGNCDRNFQRPEHLKRHKDTHSGIQNFHCVICVRDFGRNDNCKDHYLTHLLIPGRRPKRNRRWSLEELEQRVQRATKRGGKNN
ncbi:hypothetical protein V2W45_1473004 [Cenococcum geophilum]